MSFHGLFTILAIGATTVSAVPRPAGAPADGLGSSTPKIMPTFDLQPVGSNGSYNIDSAQSYRLVDVYDAGNWFSKFTVENIADPTHGYVNYVSQSEAQNKGLYRTQNGQVYIGVDTTSTLDPNGRGRDSVRIHSNTAYNHGLVIGDFAHIPGSQCGSWPAFWMVGNNWPYNGEIDIIEGVHTEQYNQMTLHTGPGCSPGHGPQGEVGYRTGNSDCGSGGGFTGCGVKTSQPNTFGTPFNANGGGVYAMLWTSQAIQVWYWAQRDVPGDIRSSNPNPSGWGRPQANFYGGCNYDNFFRNQQIIFDITFCGDWAGGVWGQSSCAQIDGSCKNYVAKQPQSFRESYWLVNSIKVYA